MSRLLLKAGLAVVVALAAGLGVGLGFQLSGLRWPGALGPAAQLGRRGSRRRTSSGRSWASLSTSGLPS